MEIQKGVMYMSKYVKILVAVGMVSLCAVTSSSILFSKANNTETNNIQNESSEELLSKVLDNEELEEIIFYNSMDDALKVAVENIDELKELVTRDDYDDVVIDAYSTYDLADSFETDASIFNQLSNSGANLDATVEGFMENESVCENAENDLEEVAKVLLLEELLTSKELLEQVDSEELETLQQVALDKYEEKKESEVHKENFDNIFERAIENETDSHYKVEVIKIDVSDRFASVTTPRGSKVVVQINDYFGDRVANLMDIRTKKKYRKAEILASSDNRYNCHSYAWYQSDTENKYWLDCPNAYVTDGSYVEALQPAVGDKVCWAAYEMEKPSFIEHSGIVDSINGKKIIIVSKWGQGPLVRHKVKYSPYKQKVHYYKSAS